MSDYLADFGKSLFVMVATLLPIINPPGSAAIFLSLTEGASLQTRRQLATRIARNVFLLSAVFLLIGSYLLRFFGISLDIIRVAGGILVTSMGWRLLNARDTEPHVARLTEAFTPAMVQAKAFYPLSFPVTIGPGSLAAVITIGASLASPTLAVATARTSGALVGLVLVALAVLLAYRYAQALLRPLGETGTLVFLRISAFVLMALGIQILWDGLGPLISAAVRNGMHG